MAEDSLSGKLVVILHADIAGSTVLVQQDKQLHTNASEIPFSDTIEKHHEHMLELLGDARFASV